MRFSVVVFCSLVFSLMACTKENFLRYSNSPRAVDLLPTSFDAGVLFFDFEGDTITLFRTAQENTFTVVDNQNPLVGGTDGIENVELELNTYTIGCQEPFFRFYYRVSAQQDGTQPRGALDVFNLRWEDSAGFADSEINLTISDSVFCSDQRCTFDTPLSFGNGNSFSNLYFTPRSANTQTRLFINESQGLVAFTLANGKTYQRVP